MVTSNNIGHNYALAIAIVLVSAIGTALVHSTIDDRQNKFKSYNTMQVVNNIT